MSFWRSLFAKILLLMLALLVPVILLIGYSHKVSVDVVEKELLQTNAGQLSFLLHQIDSSVEQLQNLAVMLNRDPSVRELPYLRFEDNPLERVKVKIAVMEKLTLQSLASPWSNEFVVYSPVVRQKIGTRSSLYDENDLTEPLSAEWRLEKAAANGVKDGRVFKRFVADGPLPVEDVSAAKLIVEASFDADNIAALLSNYETGRRGSPFLYIADESPIYGIARDRKTADAVLAWLAGQSLEQEGARRVKLNGSAYQVYYKKSRTLDGYLVDYMPVEEIVSPIRASRNIFYASMIGLLTAGAVALALLYRNVQIPIRHLVEGFKKIRDKTFAARVPEGTSREFAYVQQGFNEMAQEIQWLAGSVYEEQIRSRDAKLKQLQAQVNPHFLYNCLAYITSMNDMENREAVASMAHHLGDYYRYTTRTDLERSPLREELRLVDHYLEIYRMRMTRLAYALDVPDGMGDFIVPRLFLQPIVENAIVHGIEKKPGEAEIRISGSWENGVCVLVVDDNGAGLPEDRITELQSRISAAEESDRGYGLWNTYHRLQLMYGKSSGLELSPSPLGGLRVRIFWSPDRE